VSELWSIITATDPERRNRSLDSFCSRASTAALIVEAADLETRRHTSENLYDRVRALFFLYAIHRFHLPLRSESASSKSLIPYAGVERLLNRRYEEAISIFLAAQSTHGLSDGMSSALASAYRGLAFQTLADQVRRSVRSVRGNQWMFRTGHPSDYALRLRRELLPPTPGAPAPILHESTPVRMDLSHSGWSDIFFLGMDLPEWARVLNVSINLSLHGTQAPKPPVEAYLRVIDRPIIRLVSVDLDASVEIHELQEMFDFGRDYLGLLKAAVIASGIVPAGLEGSDQPLSDLLRQLTQRDNLGLESVSHVNNIPKGSRLAVSTNLLASLISVCMRATGQAASLTGPLTEPERRLVAARAILGEWLGGSGGGWQDSGGVWPGIKLIEGVAASEGDIEFGVSRGRLLPNHRILNSDEVTHETRQRLQDSLVLVHGGMAQDVGPILEMVTERYLLRSGKEWIARKQAGEIFDEIIDDLRTGNVAAIGNATQRNFDGPLQSIIPWASNLYTETLIREVRAAFGDAFWGFWMLGGMSGGGMGFIFDPASASPAVCPLPCSQSSTTSPSTKTALLLNFSTATRPFSPTATTTSCFRHFSAKSSVFSPPASAPTSSASASAATQRSEPRSEPAPSSIASCLTHRTATIAARHCSLSSRSTVSIPSSTSAFRPNCAPARSAFRKTASPPPSPSKTSRSTKSSTLPTTPMINSAN
jgi:hypothetical protein